MFGILFLWFIGKYFYKMAENNNQNKWLYAVLSIVVFYVGTAIGGIILGTLFVLINFDYDWNNDGASSLIAIPFGFTADYLFYIILKKKWQTAIEVNDEIQDIGQANLE